MRQCERKHCRARKKRAVFLVDGKGMCLSCFESWLEVNGMEQHRIYRTSDNERDFPAMAHCATNREVAA